jgi:hypothetical protein
MAGQLILACFAAIGIGAILLVFGLRGRRINRSPACRSCGFDLSGTLPGGVTCPECGAGLKRDKAVRIGQRRRMWSVASLGLLLIALPTGGLATAVYAVLTGADINQFKPVGLLLWEARTADGAVAENALKEFLRRRQTGKLSEAAVQNVIEAALEQQADQERPWLEDWGEFIEFARVDGLATDDQYERFYRQCIAFGFEARPSIPSGVPLPIAIRPRETRLGRSSAVSARLHLVSVVLDGTQIMPTQEAPAVYGPDATAEENGEEAFDWYVLRLAERAVWFGMASGSASRYGPMTWERGDEHTLSFPLPSGVSPGSHELVLGMQLRVEDLNVGSAFEPEEERDESDEQDAQRGTIYHRLRFEVLPADTPAVEILPTGADTEEAIRGSLHPSATVVPGDLSDRKYILTLAVQDLPCDLTFDAYLRVPGRQLLLGSVVYARSDERRALAAGQTPQIVLDGEIGKTDISRSWVLLRPKPEFGESTTNIFTAYGGMVTLTSLEVDDQTEPADGSRGIPSVPASLMQLGGSTP